MHDGCLISTAHSFQCYKCGPDKPDVGYTTEQCEQNKTKIDCSGTCYRSYHEESDGKQLVFESRGCSPKSSCDDAVKRCANDTIREVDGIKKCTVTCCVSDSDTPCNSFNNNNNNNNNNNAFTVSSHRIIVLFSLLCSFRLM